MEIMLYDWNKIRKDELLGSTVIELEQRYYNSVHGRCGVPYRYSEDEWRDHLNPEQLLEEMCLIHGLGKPVWVTENVVAIFGKKYCTGNLFSR